MIHWCRKILMFLLGISSINKQTGQFLIDENLGKPNMLKSEENFQNKFNERNGRDTLRRANDFLLTKQFKECLESCLRCIADLKSVPESARYER